MSKTQDIASAENVSLREDRSLHDRLSSVLSGNVAARTDTERSIVSARMRDLREVLGLSDELLLSDFLKLGFDAQTAPAIELIPLAFVAWANGEVSGEESTAVIKAIHESELSEFPRTWARVQTWLDVRPRPELWDLWVEYTRCRLGACTGDERTALQRRILSQATSVARASGGWLGIGSICRQEQEVIDRIAQVFRFTLMFERLEQRDR